MPHICSVHQLHSLFTSTHVLAPDRAAAVDNYRASWAHETGGLAWQQCLAAALVALVSACRDAAFVVWLYEARDASRNHDGDGCGNRAKEKSFKLYAHSFLERFDYVTSGPQYHRLRNVALW